MCPPGVSSRRCCLLIRPSICRVLPCLHACVREALPNVQGTPMKASTSLAVFTSLAAATFLAACGSTTGMGMGAGPKALATLEPTKGNTAAGTVTFEQKADKVLVTPKFTCRAPKSEHSFQVPLQ